MTEPKPVEFLGDTKEALSAMPLVVKREIGRALWAAQMGERHKDAKPLKGFGGASVLEIVSDYDTDTYRGVYTVRFAGVVYVVHVFQKKSKRGSETPRPDMKVIKQRLQEAEADYAKRLARERTGME